MFSKEIEIVLTLLQDVSNCGVGGVDGDGGVGGIGGCGDGDVGGGGGGGWSKKKFSDFAQNFFR